MKILGGKYKGRNFYRPANIRPTQNLPREAIFDILGPQIKDYEVLELFAGSGAVGFEALSRGVRMVTFVEKDPKCVAVIRKNVNLLDIDSYEIIARDAFASIKRLCGENRKFDLIFMDPPYRKGLIKKALLTLNRYDIVQPSSLVIFQHASTEKVPDQSGRFDLIKQKKYGASQISIYQGKAQM